MLKNSLPQMVTTEFPGSKSKSLLDRKKDAVPNAFDAYPVCIKNGEGAMFEDLDGNVFVDWIGGVGVLNIGYSNSEVVHAVQEQAEKYFHTMLAITTHEPYIKLAEELNKIVPCRGEEKKTFFANSGAEGVENAIKVAKAYTKRSNVICFTGAFHGRTSLGMALTANKKYALGMGPFPSCVYRCEFPYLYRAPKGYSEEEAIDYYIEKLLQVFKEGAPANEVAAIIIEPLQGEGGFIPVPFKWIQKVREICDEFGILLIADEVQSGNCRTGRHFASDYWKDIGTEPDILVTAKSIAAGLPLSAITASKEVMDRVVAGTIGGTYSGNPLSCTAAIKVLEIMQRDDYAGKANRIAEIVKRRFEKMSEKYNVIGDVRGLGAMIGIEFVKDKETKEPYTNLVSKMVDKALGKGLLMESAGMYGNIIRFLAPLVITEEQLNISLDIFEDCLNESL